LPADSRKSRREWQRASARRLAPVRASACERGSTATRAPRVSGGNRRGGCEFGLIEGGRCNPTLRNRTLPLVTLTHTARPSLTSAHQHPSCPRKPPVNEASNPHPRPVEVFHPATLPPSTQAVQHTPSARCFSESSPPRLQSYLRGQRKLAQADPIGPARSTAAGRVPRASQHARA
jgi:hypothetical protein